MCDVRSSSKQLSLKERFYSLRLEEGKSVVDHFQEINSLVTQLASLGISISDEDLTNITLNSLPKSWSTFRQVQKGREQALLFPELEGLILQEEQGCNLEKQRDEAEEVNVLRTGQSRGRGRNFYARSQPYHNNMTPAPH